MLVPPWSVTHVPKAVWTAADHTVALWVSNASIVSSLEQRNANRFARHVGLAWKETVATVEIGAFLHENVSPSDMSFMELDIECVEWVVLPPLLDSGALCRLDLLRIEWHFKSRCPGMNVSIFHDFEPRLRQRCSGHRAHPSKPNGPIYDFETDAGAG